jgi:hypothetical protein
MTESNISDINNILEEEENNLNNTLLDNAVLTQCSQEDNSSESSKRQRIESMNEVSPLIRRVYTSPVINTNESSNPVIPIGLDDWIFNRISEISKFQRSMTKKKKVLQTIVDHMTAGTFPNDVPMNRFKVYSVYPHSIPEEDRKAVNEREKEIMHQACKALLDLRIHVLNQDCITLDKDFLEPLQKHEDILKDASISFPLTKENHSLQQYIIDAISNGLINLNSSSLSRSGTPRSFAKKRRTRTPINRPPPPPPHQQATTTATPQIVLQQPPPPTIVLQQQQQHHHPSIAPSQQQPPILQQPNSTQQQPIVITLNDLNDLTDLLRNELRIGENNNKRPYSPNPSSIRNNNYQQQAAAENLNMQGRGFGNHEDQNQQRPFNSRQQSQSSFSKRQRLLGQVNLPPSQYPFNNNSRNNSNNYRFNNNNNNNYQNNYRNNYHNNNSNFQNSNNNNINLQNNNGNNSNYPNNNNNFQNNVNNNRNNQNNQQMYQQGGRGGGNGRGNPGRGNNQGSVLHYNNNNYNNQN